jgi:hypothetical protein
MDLNDPASLDPFQRKSGSQGWIIHVAWRGGVVKFISSFISSVLALGGVKIFQPPLSWTLFPRRLDDR